MHTAATGRLVANRERPQFLKSNAHRNKSAGGEQGEATIPQQQRTPQQECWWRTGRGRNSSMTGKIEMCRRDSAREGTVIGGAHAPEA
jgi:hypothetical protein